MGNFKYRQLKKRDNNKSITKKKLFDLFFYGKGFFLNMFVFLIKIYNTKKYRKNNIFMTYNYFA
jgi:hypothetical protein